MASSQMETKNQATTGPKNLKWFVEYLKNIKEPNSVIVMTGAGISTSAGIPDFRTKGTGLYDNLEKYNLPFPEAIFDLDYFFQNPIPFYLLSRELFPGIFKPTLCHYFIRLLEKKGYLLRNYTQNIDMLERLADISHDSIIEAHGSFFSSRCVGVIDEQGVKIDGCSARYSLQEMKILVNQQTVVKCTTCLKGLVKPDIVFFGEQLPDYFHSKVPTDFANAKALIVIGTSLTVHPFAGLVDFVGKDVPRLLINLEEAGNLNFTSEESLDVFHRATCDEGALEFCRLFGWELSEVLPRNDDSKKDNADLKSDLEKLSETKKDKESVIEDAALKETLDNEVENMTEASKQISDKEIPETKDKLENSEDVRKDDKEVFDISTALSNIKIINTA